MTIIEAIKSGKRFKRPTWTKFYTVSDLSALSVDGCLTLLVDNVIADDWETERDVIISAADFDAACKRASAGFSMYNPPHICEYLVQLKKELGL